MKEKGVDPSKIPADESIHVFNYGRFQQNERYYYTRSYASFSCPNTGCTQSWGKSCSWCVLDLREQRVAHKYAQECRICKSKAKPMYSKDDMTKMAEYAVNRYLRTNPHARSLWEKAERAPEPEQDPRYDALDSKLYNDLHFRKDRTYRRDTTMRSHLDRHIPRSRQRRRTRGHDKDDT